MQNKRYLLELYRYIELNPLRADMVGEPCDYSWSSYAINALGVESALQTPHPEYLTLGHSKNERLSNYRDLFKALVGTEHLKEIRESINKVLELDSERFTLQIETLTNKRVKASKPGRPRKRSIDKA